MVSVTPSLVAALAELRPVNKSGIKRYGSVTVFGWRNTHTLGAIVAVVFRYLASSDRLLLLKIDFKRFSFVRCRRAVFRFMGKSLALVLTPAVVPISPTAMERFTVKSEPLLVTTRVVSDTEPLKVMVPPTTPVDSANAERKPSMP